MLVSSFGLVLCLLIVSCSTLTIQEKPLAENEKIALKLQRELLLNQLKSWTFYGRIAFSSPEQSGSGQIQWQQTLDLFKINLHGPFGSYPVEVIGTKDSASIYSENRLIDKGPAKTILKQGFGLLLPINPAADWLKAVYGQYATEITLNNSGQPTTLSEQGWTIDYQDYKKVEQYTLPHLIKFTHDKIKIKVRIKQWILS